MSACRLDCRCRRVFIASRHDRVGERDSLWRRLTLQRTLSIWWDAARECFEVDVEGGEACEAGFDMAATSAGDANLMAVDILGGESQTVLAITRRQRHRVDHGVGGGANLVDRDLRSFPPGADWPVEPKRDD